MYLEVKFHDCDYTYCLTEALENLYRYLRESHDQNSKKETFENYVENLEVISVLDKYFLRFAVLMKMTQETATAIRLRRWCEWVEDEALLGNFVKTARYLENIELRLHKNKDFMTWNNNENCWLDLETGEVGSF